MLSRHVRRVDQLDAVSLDSELFAILNAQYRKAFSYLPSSVVAKAGPELDVLFRFLYKYLPLKYLGTTFGLNVFDLKYFDGKTLTLASERKLSLLAAISICLPWFWDRIARRLALNFCSDDWSRQIFEMSCSLELRFLILWKILSLFNFCVFLQRSIYPSLMERILQVRPLYTTPQEIKQLQYDGIGKELLWHGLSELLGFTLPLINVFRLKNYLQRISMSWNPQDWYSKHKTRNDYCLICGDIPNFPHTMGCVHVFCYYCLASMLLADPSFTCLSCDFAAGSLDCIKPVPLNRPTIKIK